MRALWPAPTVDRSAGLFRRDSKLRRIHASNAVLEAPADVRTPKEVSQLFSKLQNGSDVRGIAIAGAALERHSCSCQPTKSYTHISPDCRSGRRGTGHHTYHSFLHWNWLCKLAFREAKCPSNLIANISTSSSPPAFDTPTARLACTFAAYT